jgi:hypothetical protein
VGLFIALAVLWTGCPNPNNAGGGNSGTEPESPAVVSGEALQLDGLFDAPVAGESPDTTLSTAQYAGQIAWYEVPDEGADSALETGTAFAQGTVYKAVLTLTAKEGYTFDGLAANAFSYTGAASVTGMAGGSGTWVVTVLFPATGKTLVSDLALDDYVTAPVRGAAPVTTELDADQYSGTIVWQKVADSSAVEGTFAASTVYQAIVTLSVKGNYIFEGLAENSFTYAGVTSITGAAGSGDDEGKWIVTIVFKATAAEGQDTTVTMLSLKGKVTAPARGATPDTELDTDQYSGTIVWQKAADSSAVEGTFAPSTAYKAIVTLSAKDGFTFTGLTSSSFTYEGASSITGEAGADTNEGKWIVTIVFAETEAVPGTMVTLLALDDYLTAPVTGVSAVTAPITTAQYTGTYEWQTRGNHAVHTGPFVGKTLYDAVLTLTAEPGYTFNGLTASSFTYTNAGVTGAAGTGENAGKWIVTISFPQTDENPVTLLALDAYVTAPVKGANPVEGSQQSLNAQYAQYAPIAWSTEAGTAITAQETFAPATVYKAVIQLIATVTYTFKGLPADSFTYQDATVTHAAGTGTGAQHILTVTITFEATAGSDEDTKVNILSLTDKVTWPACNEAPVTSSFTTAQYYSGAIEWKKADGSDLDKAVFAPETSYKATVTLTAEEDFTFNGLTSGSFAYEGAASVTGAASEADWVVTIVFPPTGAAPQSRTPATDAATVTKSLQSDAAVIFNLSNDTAYEDNLVWSLYDEHDDPVTNGVTASNTGNALTLSKAGGVPPGIYKAAVTEKTYTYMRESDPITLTVRDPTSATPEASPAALEKDPDHPKYLEFTLTSNEYAGSGEWPKWKVYNASTDGQEVDDVSDDVSIEVTGTTLKLSHNTYLEPGHYYVSVQEEGKRESDRLELWVQPGTTPTDAPVVPESTVTKLSSADSVEFTLQTAFASDAVWRVYASLAGDDEYDEAVLAIAAEDTALTLEYQSGPLPNGTYYVTVQEVDKAESTPRLALYVTAAGASAAPEFTVDRVQKTTPVQDTVAFTLSSTHDNASVWRVYAGAAGGSALGTVSAGSTDATLTLTAVGTSDIPGGTYYVSVAEPGEEESLRTAVTVLEWYVVMVTFTQPLDEAESINLSAAAGLTLSWTANTAVNVGSSYISGASTKTWYLDGQKLSATTNQYAFHAQDVGLGPHTLTFQYLTTAGKLYSKTVLFEVTLDGTPSGE